VILFALTQLRTSMIQADTRCGRYDGIVRSIAAAITAIGRKTSANVRALEQVMDHANGKAHCMPSSCQYR
jgi:hypothetical protein